MRCCFLMTQRVGRGIVRFSAMQMFTGRYILGGRLWKGQGVGLRAVMLVFGVEVGECPLGIRRELRSVGTVRTFFSIVCWYIIEELEVVCACNCQLRDELGVL